MSHEIKFLAKKLKEFIEIISVRKIVAPKNNQAVYDSDDVVGLYFSRSNLQPPEATILEKFRNKLPQMRMLDIGVGAGRTSAHFAILTQEYLGIDYSNKMINACLRKFKSYPEKIQFLLSDARTMSRIKDNSFDFILFSFNGLDMMPHNDRIGTLREMRRIVKSGGYVCFSTHNLNFLLNKCSIQHSRHPTELIVQILQLLQMRFLNNRKAWKAIRNPIKGKSAIVNDGALDFRLKTYYITPSEQLKQLGELGYLDSQMFSLTDGKEMEDLNNATDHWIYYLSKAP